MQVRRISAAGILILSVALAGAAPIPPAAPLDLEKTLMPHTAWNCGMPEGIPKPEAGKLVFEADMKLDQLYDVGKTPFGQRHVLVVQGGTVTGEKIKATVMTGGLDFQLTLDNGVVEIEQVMVLKTEDNKYIYMRNAGVGTSAKDVRVVMDIEAPTGHASAWVNTGKYVARRTVDPVAKTMKMSVYDVSGWTIDLEKSVKVTKPAGVPQQPWDYRRVDPAEKQGEVIATENVTLAGSQSVGASKRGNRNVIPITGGTLSGGLVPGKVLPGGADYQNLSAAPAIDARYLWQTPEGDIIIVRNTTRAMTGAAAAPARGPATTPATQGAATAPAAAAAPGAPGAPGARGPGGFPGGGRGGPGGGGGMGGGLVPVFEVKTDSKYAWLNSGKYLSSGPGMGAGGVSLTLYKSTQ